METVRFLKLLEKIELRFQKQETVISRPTLFWNAYVVSFYLCKKVLFINEIVFFKRCLAPARCLPYLLLRHIIHRLIRWQILSHRSHFTPCYRTIRHRRRIRLIQPIRLQHRITLLYQISHSRINRHSHTRHFKIIHRTYRDSRPNQTCIQICVLIFVISGAL